MKRVTDGIAKSFGRLEPLVTEWLTDAEQKDLLEHLKQIDPDARVHVEGDILRFVVRADKQEEVEAAVFRFFLRRSVDKH